MARDQNPGISDAFRQEQARLRGFIRQRVPNLRDAEDILQDVFYRLVEANRLLMPIEHLTGWLYQVARNRIVDLYRKQRPDSFSDAAADADEDALLLEELLPASDDGPAAAYARQALMEELAQAIGELPAEQRDVFVAHELEGRSFKEMAAYSGENINTLLARKRYAVLALRAKLHHTYQDYLEG